MPDIAASQTCDYRYGKKTLVVQLTEFVLTSTDSQNRWAAESLAIAYSPICLADITVKAMADHVCLIVDDEPSIRTFIRVILDGESLQSLEAGSAAEALKIVQKLGGRLDLIVSDIKMPGDMDGVDLAYSIRHSYPAVPVILISGFADEEAVKHADADFAFIQKPFVPETILTACRRAMLTKVPAQSDTLPKKRAIAG